MGKGKWHVQEYEACAKHLQKSLNEKYCSSGIEKGTNKTPKKKKRKK
jgi:hypothetical protein